MNKLVLVLLGGIVGACLYIGCESNPAEVAGSSLDASEPKEASSTLIEEEKEVCEYEASIPMASASANVMPSSSAPILPLKK